MGCHCNVLFADRRDPSPTAEMVDRSTDLVGDAFALVRASYRRKSRYLVEELRDVRTRAWRLGHRSRPAREHDEIEVDGTELIAEEQGTVGFEMIFNDIKEGTGTR